MKYALLIITLVVIAVAFTFLWITQRELNTGEADIGGTRINVEIASTIPTRTKGLSDRVSLADDTGMVFVFPVAAKHPIWMKDMNFAIDIIWVRREEIVDIAPNVKPPGPDGELRVYKPRLEADMVVEVVSGFTEEHGIKIGDELKVVQ